MKSQTTLIKERPILFSAAMVRALLDGSKTQTRRVVKNAPYGLMECHYSGGQHAPADENGGCTCKPVVCPYGQPGDRLYVRETFCQWPGGNYWYAADGKGEGSPVSLKWKPSIHMPRVASRLILEITAVRCERVQELGGRDAFAEGMRSYYTEKHVAKHGMRPVGIIDDCCLINTYETIWKEINGPDSWAANPWVWVVEFKVISPAATPQQESHE